MNCSTVPQAFGIFGARQLCAGILALLLPWVGVAVRATDLQPGQLDPTFVVSALAANEQVSQFLVLPDEKILVASYTFGPGPMQRRLLRLLPDGGLDPEFKEIAVTGAALWNMGVTAMVLQGDRILVGGDFQQLNGKAVPGLERLLPDGSLDPSFLHVPLAPFAYGIETLAVTADGSILVSGEVASSGRSRQLLTKLRPDGEFDGEFSAAIDVAGSVNIAGLTPATDGSFLVHGVVVAAAPDSRVFGLFNLDSKGRLIRDFRSPYGDRPIAPNAIARLASGKVLAASLGFPAYALLRLEADGTRDTGFSIGWGPDNQIRQIVEQPDGRILVAGSFATWSFESQPILARLEPDGRLDRSFRPPAGPINSVFQLALQNSRRAIIGGVILGTDGASSRPLGAIYLGPPPESPSRILRGPTSIHAEIGDRASLTVEATGYPRRAQWFRNQQPIPGATNEWLRFETLTAEDAGFYFVSLINPLGAVSSDTVSVQVDPLLPGPNLIRNPSFESLPPGAPLDDGSTVLPLDWGVEAWQATLVRSPAEVPVNFFGTEDALQGTNYLRLDYYQSDGGGLMRGGRVRGALVEPLEPGARYAFSAWLSLADRSLAPAVAFQVYLQGPGLGSLPLGRQVVTNRDGWTSMKTFVVPGNGYNQVVLEAQLEPTDPPGSRYLYIDKLALVKVEDRTPRFTPRPPVALSPFSPLWLTNTLETPDFREVLDQNVRFRLGAAAPADAVLDPYWGTLYWQPDPSLVGSTITIPVEASILQSAAPPSTNQIKVEIQQGVSITLGTHLATAGSIVHLPLTVDARLAPGDALETLIYYVAPIGPSFFSTPLAELSREVAGVEFLTLDHGVVRVAVNFRPGQFTAGARPIGTLALSVGSSLPTGDYSIALNSVSAMRTGLLPVPVGQAQDGILRVVGREPLLRAEHRHGVPTLLLYGTLGHRYRVEQTTRVQPTPDWQELREVVAESFPQELPDLNLKPSTPARFFRILDLTP